jgi:Na+/H+-dicarboxylate symporter
LITSNDTQSKEPQSNESLLRFLRFTSSLSVILGCVLFGIYLGWLAPELSKNLKVVGVLYVDLLKMIVLPFMLSAVIFSLQKLFQEGGTAKLIRRVFIVFAGFAVAASLLATLVAQVIQPGGGMSSKNKTELGVLVGEDSNSSNTEMSFYKDPPAPKELTAQDIVKSLVPSNIFESLALGETLKILLFAMMFGFAVGVVPSQGSRSLEQALETVYHACQAITRWVNIPAPLVLICMTASQIGDTGIEPLLAMFEFVLTFLAISLLLLAVSLGIIWWRSGNTFATVLSAMRVIFTLGVATNNSATCMPVMISGLVDTLRFNRSQVELLVPLSVSILRVGAVAYFVCSIFFIAALYDHTLTIFELGIIALVSIMSGFASIGMSGIMTVSLVGNICSYIRLPFEAAFILLVAVDSICAMARTAVTVISSCASVAMICPKPLTPQASKQVDVSIQRPSFSGATKDSPNE